MFATLKFIYTLKYTYTYITSSLIKECLFAHKYIYTDI